MSARTSVPIQAPQWFANATCTGVCASKSHFRYRLITYNSVTITVTEDMNKFRAEDVLKTFSRKNYSAFLGCKKGEGVVEAFADVIDEVKGSGNTSNGHYYPWCLFNTVLYYAADTINAVRFESGLPIDLDAPKRGFLYLVQPGKAPKGMGVKSCVGSPIYKYGRTWRLDQRMGQYGEDTKVWASVAVDDMYLCEKVLMTAVMPESIDQAPVSDSDEYFRMDSLRTAVSAFIKAVSVMDAYGYGHGEIEIDASVNLNDDDESA